MAEITRWLCIEHSGIDSHATVARWPSHYCIQRCATRVRAPISLGDITEFSTLFKCHLYFPLSFNTPSPQHRKMAALAPVMMSAARPVAARTTCKTPRSIKRTTIVPRATETDLTEKLGQV